MGSGKIDELKKLVEENIRKLRALPQKNIAANILMRVMKDKVNEVKKVNLVQSREFSEKLQKIIDKYNNRNDQENVFKILEELVKFKDALIEAIQEGTQMELSYEEKAFFDVLTADPDVIKQMDSEILIKIAKELTKTIKENMTHAWYEKAQAQAKMRREIKRLLRKYDYPPNKSDKAIEDVLEQAKLQCTNHR